MSDLAQYALGLLALVVVGYVLSRVVAVAWFRTKTEHVRRIMREMKGED